MQQSLIVWTHSPLLAEQLTPYVKLRTELNTIDDDHWWLNYEANGLTLQGFLDGQKFTLCFDLMSGQMRYRQQHGGGRKEPLAKAVGIKGNLVPKILDATAGMGREAFLLASLGCSVTAVERHPIIFALLQDAVTRLMNDHQTPLMPTQLRIIWEDSISYIETIDSQDFDVIYLDPMFPEREKSAAVKKEMRVFKRLAGQDQDDVKLLTAALNAKCKRVVVKRPNYAPSIGNVKPSFQIQSKKHRFDVYLP
jgi:16S rRNA (guanine1516-N2)-methyltransferase